MARIIITLGLFILSGCQSSETKIINSIDALTKTVEKLNSIERERNQMIKDGLRLQEAVHKDRLDTSTIYTRIYTE